MIFGENVWETRLWSEGQLLGSKFDRIVIHVDNVFVLVNDKALEGRITILVIFNFSLGYLTLLNFILITILLIKLKLVKVELIIISFTNGLPQFRELCHHFEDGFTQRIYKLGCFSVRFSALILDDVLQPQNLGRDELKTHGHL